MKNQKVETIQVENKVVAEEVVEEIEESVEITLAQSPIKIGENVCNTADIAVLAVLLNITARQMLKLLNRDLIRGVYWSKEANDDIDRIRYHMAEYEMCGFTTYTKII